MNIPKYHTSIDANQFSIRGLPFNTSDLLRVNLPALTEPEPKLSRQPLSKVGEKYVSYRPDYIEDVDSKFFLVDSHGFLIETLKLSCLSLVFVLKPGDLKKIKTFCADSCIQTKEITVNFLDSLKEPFSKIVYKGCRFDRMHMTELNVKERGKKIEVELFFNVEDFDEMDLQEVDLKEKEEDSLAAKLKEYGVG